MLPSPEVLRALQNWTIMACPFSSRAWSKTLSQAPLSLGSAGVGSCMKVIALPEVASAVVYPKERG